MQAAYAENDKGRYEPPACLRCRRRPEVEWCGTQAWSETVARWRPVLLVCQTPGCVDEHGSNVVPFR